MAELTFYDTLVAVAAAEGARRRRAWIIERERKPLGWTGEERVDLVVSRLSTSGSEAWVSATELKWWRASDKANASNRRRDLVVDFMRAAAVKGFIGVENAVYVVLVSTSASWDATTTVKPTAGDAVIASCIKSTGVCSWSMRKLKKAPAVKNAVVQLHQSLPITSSFATNLVEHVSAPVGGRTYH